MSHSSEELAALFPSFIVAVGAGPSVGPRDGEILLGGPILRRKHMCCSSHSSAQIFQHYSNLDSSLIFFSFSQALPLTSSLCPTLQAVLTPQGTLSERRHVSLFRWPCRGHRYGYIAYSKGTKVPSALMLLITRERGRLPAAENGWNRGHRACHPALRDLKQRQRSSYSVRVPSFMLPPVFTPVESCVKV